MLYIVQIRPLENNIVMTESLNQNTPWRNGYWISKSHRPHLTYVENENIYHYYSVKLDHPDLKPHRTGTRMYGDFGPAPQELVELTGIKNYNVKSIGIFERYLIVNPEGTKLYSMATGTNGE